MMEMFNKEQTIIFGKPVYKITISFALAVTLIMGLFTETKAQPLSFVLDTPPYRQQEAYLIAEQLEKLGIRVEVQIWEKGILSQMIKAGDRAAYLTDWGSAYFDPYDLAQPKLSSEGVGNYSFYSNPEVDMLLKHGSSSISERYRLKSYYKIQRIIFYDAPCVFGYSLDNIEAASVQVDNFAPSMDNRINLHDVRLKKGDTIVVGMNTDAFISLDPAAFRSRETETMIRNMFDALVTRTREGKVVPELAESWKQEDDKTYIFKLRKGPKFHNEDPVTADDVVFTFKRIITPNAINGKSSPRKDLLGPINKVEKIDETHVRFVLDRPFPIFLQALVHFQIVPQKYIETVGDKRFSEKPVGAGPFRFVSGKLDSEIVMERFDGYYGGSPKLKPVLPAHVKKAIFRAMPEPFNRVAALLANEVSIIQAVPIDMVDQLKQNNAVQIFTVEGTRSYQIELNNKIPPFNDIRVRQVLNHAIDWETILKDVYQDYGRRLATCFLPSGFGYYPNLKPYSYDPKKAKKLLIEAGFNVK